MIVQVNPQQPYPIVYQIADANDATTYFVRAVVRDSNTGSTIQTINLNNEGNGRFTQILTAPADTTGNGRYFDITVTVYEDSGYTIKSSNYQQVKTEYISDTRWNFRFRGGGGGSDLSLEDIRKIVRDAIIPINEKLGTIETKVDESDNDATEVILGASTTRLDFIKGQVQQLHTLMDTKLSNIKEVKTVEVKEVGIDKYAADVRSALEEFKTEDVSPAVKQLVTMVETLTAMVESLGRVHARSREDDTKHINTTITEAVRDHKFPPLTAVLSIPEQDKKPQRPQRGLAKLLR